MKIEVNIKSSVNSIPMNEMGKLDVGRVTKQPGYTYENYIGDIVMRTAGSSFEVMSLSSPGGYWSEGRGYEVEVLGKAEFVIKQ